MSIDLHTLSGAYAIDALSPAEAEEFEKHLDDCPACRDEVRELQSAAARMGAGEATAPPPSLKARVLAAADQQPQLRPKVSAIESRRPRRWAPRVAAAVGGLAAAAILAVAALGGIDWPGGGQTPSSPPLAGNEVSQVFEASDAHVATMRTADGHRLTVATSLESGQMAIKTRTLAELKGDRVYQMWAKHNGRVTSVGLIEDLRTGKVMPIPTYGTTVAITVEPEGGSKKPTNPPIVEMDPQAI
ncbi:MAG TPA: anti-sigma factor [Propionibacteriaceae bacterium]|jgi:anti-sigma-K factor RskA